MELTAELKALGVDVDEGLDRVMGDMDLYSMTLGMFVDAVMAKPIQLAEFDAADLAELTGRVHTLKGVTGNLAITPLFNAYTEILGLLRAGQGAQAKAKFEKIMPVQEEVLACIQRHKD